MKYNELIGGLLTEITVGYSVEKNEYYLRLSVVKARAEKNQLRGLDQLGTAISISKETYELLKENIHD